MKLWKNLYPLCFLYAVIYSTNSICIMYYTSCVLGCGLIQTDLNWKLNWILVYCILPVRGPRFTFPIPCSYRVIHGRKRLTLSISLLSCITLMDTEVNKNMSLTIILKTGLNYETSTLFSSLLCWITVDWLQSIKLLFCLYFEWRVCLCCNTPAMLKPQYVFSWSYSSLIPMEFWQFCMTF